MAERLPGRVLHHGDHRLPTLRWLGKNDPDTNTWVGTRNPRTPAGRAVRPLVFVSSAGVKRYDAGLPTAS